MARRRLGSPDVELSGAGPRSRLTGSLSRVLLAVAMLAALGALLFGLWHVVVGGLVNGNVNAAAFGIALAVVSGGFLGGLMSTRRRLGRRAVDE